MKIFRDEIKIEWTSNDAGYENSEPTSNCTLRHVLAVWKVSLQNPYIAHWLHMTDNFPSHLFFNFCLSKLYTNSLMSSFNSRSGWKYNDTTLSFEHNQVVCYLFIHSQLDSLHVCVCVCVGRESRFFHVLTLVFFYDCDDDELWALLNVFDFFFLDSLVMNDLPKSWCTESWLWCFFSLISIFNCFSFFMTSEIMIILII